MRFERSRAKLVLLALVPVIVGAGIASSVRKTGYVGNFLANVSKYSIIDILIQTIISTLLGSFVVGILFWLLKQHGHGARKFVVALVVSPILGFVSIFLGETLLLVMLKGSYGVLEGILLVVSVGISMFAVVLIALDIIPSLIRNLFVAFYGSIFGTFLGVTMVTPSILVIIFSVIIEDYLLTSHHPVAELSPLIPQPGRDPFDYTQVKLEKVSVGAGDYVVYALISAHVLIFFPWFVWMMSLLLLFVGILINAVIFSSENKIFPAIPLPALLALYPWIAHLLALFYMG